MQTNDAIQEMLKAAGKTAYGLSLELGRAHSFITSTLKRKGGVGAPLLASIADKCGYNLVLVNKETKEQITIDPAID